MAESFRVPAGIALAFVGVLIIITAIFRALGDNWPLVGHERWAVPAVGLGLFALGEWLLS